MMMLIVEDDEHKLSQIQELVNSWTEKRINKFIADNVWDAVRFLRDSIPSKVILDMSLPSHKALLAQGTPVPLPTGGIEILFELKKKGLTYIPILILTQYPEIEIEGEPIPVQLSADTLMSEYGFTDIEACYYDNTDGKVWKSSTIRFLGK